MWSRAGDNVSTMTSKAVHKTSSVGIRQLKAELSQQLRRVRAGETIEVTDRGRVIAMITPVSSTEDHPAIVWARSMIAAGKVSWSGKRLTPPERRARLGGNARVSDAVIEDRR